MATLAQLKREAREAATWRNHTLTRFHRSNDGRFHVARCSQCGQQVAVITHPLPNEIEIGGEAVALNCQGSR